MAQSIKEAETHPAYGILTFTRSNHSTSSTLYGSSIHTQHTIVMEVHAASRYRNLSQDSHMAEELLLRAEMSPTQFADAITNMSQNGSPITLRFVSGDPEHRPPPPADNLAHQFGDDHQDSVAETLNLLDDAIAHPRMPAAIHRKIQSARGHLLTSIPFLEKQFRQQMERSVTEAKASVEAFANEREKLMGRSNLETPPVQIALYPAAESSEGTPTPDGEPELEPEQ